MTNGNTKPRKKFQAGAVHAAVWQNTRSLANGREVPVMSVTLDRHYKDGDGKWQSTESLQTNDLPKAMLVLSKAYDYVLSGDAEQQDGDAQDGDDK